MAASKEDIIGLIIPNNPLEHKVVNNKSFIKGALHGKPRSGHPEGEVIHHIHHVLMNIRNINLTLKERDDLRFIAIVHDTFKFRVDRKKPRVGENHHATIARRFAGKYVKEERVLEIIELHDEAYNAWNMGNSKHKWDRAEERLRKLLLRLEKTDALKMYTIFYDCDNSTGDKTRDNYEWFLEQVEKYEQSKPKEDVKN